MSYDLGRGRHLHRRLTRCSPASGILLVAATTWCGCAAISIEPSCPNELEVGGSGPVRANQENPGSIPSYLWEVFPSDAGSFGNSAAPDTTFHAEREVDVVIRLTASDGLFQVISGCSTRIVSSAAPVVTLEAIPNPAVVGNDVMLTCASVGETQAALLTVTQVEGADVTLTDLIPGVVTFKAEQAGDFTFQCVGESAGGTQSEPASVTVGVDPATDDTSDDSDGGDDDASDNGGGRPPPGPRR